MKRLLCALVLAGTLHGESVFAKPTKWVRGPRGSRISLYCAGTGWPAVILESGFGGGSQATWEKLHPQLSAVTRTCAYDRAGYGQSKLGNNLPRDLNHAVEDLHALLGRSGMKPPYVLVGHSNGGFIIGAFADRFPKLVAGLVFLDAAVALSSDDVMPGPRTLSASQEKHLQQIRAKGTADEWRAYLSEAENNYRGIWSMQARATLPHRWQGLPIRVFTAVVSKLTDDEASRLFGIPAAQREELAQAKANRAVGEGRQAALCTESKNCKAVPVPTGNHLVHNEVPQLVLEAIGELLAYHR